MARLAYTTTHLYALLCRTCGQTGTISITQNGQREWHFAAVGFIGMAINRHNPPNSVLRCNMCGSPQVRVQPSDTA